MSVVYTKTSKNSRNGAAANAEPDQYAGLFLNPGIFVGNGEEDKKFVRFNKGVAISDLKIRKLYESMDPDFAAEQNLLNQRLERIQAKALTLEEGEHCVVNIPVVIYRRMEEADVAPTPKADIASIDDELFG